MKLNCLQKEIQEVRSSLIGKMQSVSIPLIKDIPFSDCIETTSINVRPDDWKIIPDYNIAVILCSLNDVEENDITVINVKFSKGGNIPPHRHDREEKVYVISGKLYDPISKKTFKEGEVQVIKSGELHGSISDNCLATVTWKPAYKVLPLV